MLSCSASFQTQPPIKVFAYEVFSKNILMTSDCIVKGLSVRPKCLQKFKWLDDLRAQTCVTLFSEIAKKLMWRIFNAHSESFFLLCCLTTCTEMKQMVYIVSTWWIILESFRVLTIDLQPLQWDLWTSSHTLPAKITYITIREYHNENQHRTTPS